MTLQEAQRLLEIMRRSIDQDDLQVRRLGNGEYIILLKHRNVHIWSKQDWLDSQVGKTARLDAERASRDTQPIPRHRVRHTRLKGRRA